MLSLCTRGLRIACLAASLPSPGALVQLEPIHSPSPGTFHLPLVRAAVTLFLTMSSGQESVPVPLPLHSTPSRSLFLTLSHCRYLTKKEAMNYKLEVCVFPALPRSPSHPLACRQILNSLLPLLSPTLLPSHTTESPSKTDTTLHAHIHAAKRKHDEEKPPVPAAVHGLGLGLAAGVKLEPDVKCVSGSFGIE